MKLLLDYLAVLHHQTAPDWLPAVVNLVVAIVAGIIALGVLR